MAAFFNVPASAGVVVRAEHRFTLRVLPAARAGRLTCRWTHDADGQLILAWEAGPGRHEANPPHATTSAA